LLYDWVDDARLSFYTTMYYWLWSYTIYIQYYCRRIIKLFYFPKKSLFGNVLRKLFTVINVQQLEIFRFKFSLEFSNSIVYSGSLLIIFIWDFYIFIYFIYIPFSQSCVTIANVVWRLWFNAWVRSLISKWRFNLNVWDQQHCWSVLFMKIRFLSE